MKRTLAALLLCTAFAGCKHGGGGVSAVEAGAPFRPSARGKLQESAININNLDAEIADDRKRAARGEVFFRRKLPAALVERASFLGVTGDYDEADDVSAKNRALEPNEPTVLMARAQVLGALHKFDDALRELDAADAHKAEHDEVLRARATIFLATGRCAEAHTMWPALPYATDMAARGAMEQRLGHPELAETLFERGRIEFADVSPVRFAWMDFERARAFEREGDTAHARAYLEDALEVFPEYAHAAVHVAALVSPERAIALLETVEKRADEPDVFAAHADALRRAKRDGEAGTMTARAKARFEEVLAKHPEAYADHAARFFLGAGADLKRALELAKSAATRAPTEETLELWLLAARASANNGEACAAVDAAAKTTCPLRGSRGSFDRARASCKP